jgi:hypothetical protein
MGTIDVMAIGNPIPNVPLSLGSPLMFVVPLLVLLGVAALGILRVIPSRPRLRALHLVPEGH